MLTKVSGLTDNTVLIFCAITIASINFVIDVKLHKHHSKHESLNLTVTHVVLHCSSQDPLHSGKNSSYIYAYGNEHENFILFN